MSDFLNKGTCDYLSQVGFLSTDANLANTDFPGRFYLSDRLAFPMFDEIANGETFLQGKGSRSFITLGDTEGITADPTPNLAISFFTGSKVIQKNTLNLTVTSLPNTGSQMSAKTEPGGVPLSVGCKFETDDNIVYVPLAYVPTSPITSHLFKFAFEIVPSEMDNSTFYSLINIIDASALTAGTRTNMYSLGIQGSTLRLNAYDVDLSAQTISLPDYDSTSITLKSPYLGLFFLKLVPETCSVLGCAMIEDQLTKIINIPLGSNNPTFYINGNGYYMYTANNTLFSNFRSLPGYLRSYSYANYSDSTAYMDEVAKPVFQAVFAPYKGSTINNIPVASCINSYGRATMTSLAPNISGSTMSDGGYGGFSSTNSSGDWHYIYYFSSTNPSYLGIDLNDGPATVYFVFNVKNFRRNNINSYKNIVATIGFNSDWFDLLTDPGTGIMDNLYFARSVDSYKEPTFICDFTSSTTIVTVSVNITSTGNFTIKVKGDGVNVTKTKTEPLSYKQIQYVGVGGNDTWNKATLTGNIYYIGVYQKNGAGVKYVYDGMNTSFSNVYTSSGNSAIQPIQYARKEFHYRMGYSPTSVAMPASNMRLMSVNAISNNAIANYILGDDLGKVLEWVVNVDSTSVTSERTILVSEYFAYFDGMRVSYITFSVQQQNGVLYYSFVYSDNSGLTEDLYPFKNSSGSNISIDTSKSVDVYRCVLILRSTDASVDLYNINNKLISENTYSKTNTNAGVAEFDYMWGIRAQVMGNNAQIYVAGITHMANVSVQRIVLRCNANGTLVEANAPAQQLTQILNYSGSNTSTTAVTLNMSRAFNPSNGYRIEMYCRVNSVEGGTMVRLFTIHSQTTNSTPREVQVYGDTSTGVLSVGIINSSGSTIYNTFSIGFTTGVYYDIELIYDANTKERKDIVLNKGTQTDSNFSPIDRNCSYAYCNGEKYYNTGRGSINYSYIRVYN